MDKHRYEKTIGWITASKRRKAAFGVIYKILPLCIFAAYPIMLCRLFFSHDSRLLPCIFVPLTMFITLSAARRFINLPRPYEVYDITPVFPKDKKGHSFPSRHTGSAFVIAATFLYISIPLGIIMTFAAVLIAASRVLGGVHFPRDVIAGFVYAALCSIVYIFI